MSKRIYHAPLGATSISVNGQTYDVDGKGRLHCEDESAHAELLSHGYTFGDAPAAPAGDSDATKPGLELARWQRELDDREATLKSVEAGLVERETTLREVGESLSTRENELAARAADLANKETDMAMRVFALDQREAALAAAAPPPPPPPADQTPAKGKGK